MNREGLNREVLKEAKVSGPMKIDLEWSVWGGGGAKVKLPGWLEHFVQLEAKAATDPRNSSAR
jgi:hypothetical protein